MQRFKDENWVKKRTNLHAAAYPVTSSEEVGFFHSPRYNQKWGAKAEISQRKEEYFQNMKQWEAVERKGKIAQNNTDTVKNYTPYQSKLGYTREFTGHKCLDHLGEEHQQYATLPISKIGSLQPLSVKMPGRSYTGLGSLEPVNKSARSHKTQASTGSNMYTSIRYLPGTKSGPATLGRRSAKLKTHPLMAREEFQVHGLYPPPSRGAMQDFLGVTYKEPWKHFKVLQ